MTGSELLYIIGGFLMGFAVCDAWYWLRRPVQRPKSVADGWNDIRHVRILRDGDRS